MNVIIFGASGSVGIELVKRGLEKGITVTAFVRKPDAFPLAKNENLAIFKGDVLDTRAVERAVANQDAVFCALGDGRAGKIRAAGTRNIIDAMNTAHIKRFICQTTLGLGESYHNLNFVWKHIMFGMLLKKSFKDHQLQEEYVFKSNLDYTVVRPSALTNGDLSNDYLKGFDGSQKNLLLKISRKGVADFMINQLTDSAYLRKTVSISK